MIQTYSEMVTTPPASTTRTAWGRWRFNPHNLTLVHAQGSRDEYEIDLERITTAGDLLNWIFQVQLKGWVDAQMLADLLAAVRDLLYPRAGYWRGPDPVAVRELLAKRSDVRACRSSARRG